MDMVYYKTTEWYTIEGVESKGRLFQNSKFWSFEGGFVLDFLIKGETMKEMQKSVCTEIFRLLNFVIKEGGEWRDGCWENK